MRGAGECREQYANKCAWGDCQLRPNSRKNKRILKDPASHWASHLHPAMKQATLSGQQNRNATCAKRFYQGSGALRNDCLCGLLLSDRQPSGSHRRGGTGLALLFLPDPHQPPRQVRSSTCALQNHNRIRRQGHFTVGKNYTLLRSQSHLLPSGGQRYLAHLRRQIAGNSPQPSLD